MVQSIISARVLSQEVGYKFGSPSYLRFEVAGCCSLSILV